MFAGIIIIPIGITLFYQSFVLAGESIRESVQSMVASVIGMIPEGLFLLSRIERTNKYCFYEKDPVTDPAGHHSLWRRIR